MTAVWLPSVAILRGVLPLASLLMLADLPSSNEILDEILAHLNMIFVRDNVQRDAATIHCDINSCTILYEDRNHLNMTIQLYR